MNEVISVIIPCYNDGAYLEEAIRSVVHQTLVPQEIIVVDDGSTDLATQQALDLIEKKYPVKVIRQPNKGTSAARNAAIALATGEYILPLDADDTFEPQFIERAFEILKSDPQIKGVSSYARKFGIYSGIIELKGGEIRDFIIDSPIMLSSIIRKVDWTRIGGFDENMRIGYEDWEFWIRMLADGGRIHVIPEPLFNYRTKEFSRAVSSGISRYEIMEYMVRKNIEVYRQYPLEAVLCSERLLKETKEKYNRLLHNVYNSASYRLGYALLSPFRIFKRRNK
ncbi:MAG: glycosyltransferase family A protein [Bacteroidales bacterium]